MKKKYLAIIGAVMLAVSVLCSCSNNAETDVENNIQSEQENSKEEKTEIINNTNENETETSKDGAKFIFTTTDIDGNSVSIDDYSEAKVIMVNFWEPWCGPCVGEMPDIEKIYEEYSSQGLMILGIFSTSDMTDEVREVMKKCGTTYPVINYTDSMEPFITEYVPTTVFIDSQGNLLSSEPVIGGNSYDDWKNIIDEYMNK